MPTPFLLSAVALMLACSDKAGPSPGDDSAGTTGATDTATGDTTDTGGTTDTAADTADEPTTDDTGGSTSGPDDTAPTWDEVQVSDVTWTLNPDIAAIIHVSWQQDAAADAWVEFRLDGEDWRASPRERREVGAQEVLLLGVPYDSDVTFRVVNDFGDGPLTTDELTAHTDLLPEDTPVPVLNVADADRWDPDSAWLLIGLSGGGSGWNADIFWRLIVDRQGRIVWAQETPNDYRTFYMQPSYDGSAILWEENTFWTDFDEGLGTIAHRMTIDGTITETFDLSGMHHAFLELAGGVMLWSGFDGEHEVIRERPPGGEEREIWDGTEFWETQGEAQDCDINALYWNEADDTIYLSSDNGNAVMEIDRSSGAVIHVWGQLRDAWAFAEGSNPFWNQHSPTRTAEGNLLVSTWVGQRDQEMVAREYVIDEENEVLREVWSCGEGSGIEAGAAGEAHRLAGGNTLLNYGTGGHLREYTSDCEVVWHAEWTNGNLLGRAIFLEDLYAFAP